MAFICKQTRQLLTLKSILLEKPLPEMLPICAGIKRMAKVVQWHPELMDIDASRRLFALLVDSCRHSGHGLII